jgi:ATP-dependent Lon protease
VRWIDQVLEVALEKVPQPLPDDEVPAKAEGAAATPPVAPAAAAGDALPH